MFAFNRLIVLACLSLATILATGCNNKNDKIDDARVASQLKLSKENVVALRQSAGVSTRNLVKISPTELRDTLRELRLPDLPQARADYEQLLEQSESGHVPFGARVRAVHRLNELKALVASRRFAVAGIPVSTNRLLARTAGLNPEQVKWVPLGPSEVGGRTRSIAFNPKNSKEMWIGSVAGGIWHSIDGGASFEAVDDFMKNLVISTIVVDPLHPNVMYAGTGEGFLNSDALRGAGIFRTEDGLHWNQIPGTNNNHFRFVNRLAISPDGKTMLAATGDGIFISTDSDHAKWTDAPALPGNIAQVIFHPSDSSVVLASGAMETGEIYHSENGGASWQRSVHDGSWLRLSKNSPPRQSRVEIIFALADPRTVYASVDENSGEIWRSTDTGHTFSKMDNSTPDGVLAYYLGEQGWYDNCLWAGDPNDSNLLVVGGIDLWKSVDGGKTLTPISDWQNEKNVLHPDQHVIVSPPIPGTSAVFVGNDGGLFKTEDIKTAGSDSANISGWTKIGHHYSVTQFYNAAWSPTTGVLIGGAQDNGTLRLSKNAKPEDWSELFGGDGGNCAADAKNGDYFYGEYAFLDVFRSSDGGKSAEEISGQFWNDQDKQFEWKQPPYVIPDAQAYKANFIAPFNLDANNPNTILAGGASLWRTDDARTPNDQTKGPKWRAVKPPEVDRSTNPPSLNLISAIAVNSQNSRTIWVGHNNGDIFVTINGDAGHPSWRRINGKAAGLPIRIVTRIVFDPVDANTAYVTYGGYNEDGKKDNVWRTSSGGKTWTNVSGSLPSVPAFALTINPQNHNFIYLATEVGLFASEDMGSHWSPTTVEARNEGPTNAAVMDLLWMNTSLVAVTHGRGLFSTEINLPKKNTLK
jgi:photosystem II stability/assembly factor-like uncharacterized protein